LACVRQGPISMDMTGERRIPAPRHVVWDALNDTAVLKASIPGCESLEKTGDNQMKAVAAVKLGPISARFNGAVTLSDIDAPNGYTITGEGQGGVAGFAKGGAKVSLTDDAEATLLKYQVNAQVGGKLAQLGARLIDATAKQMAEQFFTKFSDEVQKLVPADMTPVEAAPVVTEPALVTRGAAGPVMPGTSPADVKPAPVQPPSSVSLLDPVRRQPFGLPVMGWIGIALFAGILVLTLASML
jgi:carbon monoxide dehydrogenase subunit G